MATQTVVDLFVSGIGTWLYYRPLYSESFFRMCRIVNYPDVYNLYELSRCENNDLTSKYFSGYEPAFSLSSKTLKTLFEKVNTSNLTFRIFVTNLTFSGHISSMHL